MAEQRPDPGSGPPPRWRVVERDRRLVVIDTATGEAASSGPGPAPATRLPGQVRFDGSAALTTHRFYDEKAPRTIRLDPASAAAVGKVKLFAVVIPFVALALALTLPWLLLPFVFVFWNRAARTQLRRAATGWLDRIEREAS